MTTAPKIGLLPLYIALYDELLPALRDEFTDFLETVTAGLQSHGSAVQRAPICCVANEFSEAIRQLEDDGVDLIVTLHLAYSPSLESADALCETSLPILMLDTSMDAAFGIDVSCDRIMYNHGVHGVMDLASVLRRRGRAYDVVAGHCSDPRVQRQLSDRLNQVAGSPTKLPAAKPTESQLDEASKAPSLNPIASGGQIRDCIQSRERTPLETPVLKQGLLGGRVPLTRRRQSGLAMRPSHARAELAARTLRNTRTLRVGPIFPGMGDFLVDEEVLEATLGITVKEIGLDMLDDAVAAISDDAVVQELASDQQQYDCELSAEAHERAIRVGLGLRHLLDDGDYGAFSVNFQVFDRADRPACTMPFLECSKAMGRGIGYAGEGDVLTAALVGALAKAFDAVTFTEIFCADWRGNSLFLSHMGEISPCVAADTPRVFEKPLPFIGGHAPAVLTCAMEPGPAVLVNLAPGPDNTFSLIVAPVQVLAEDATLDPAMRDAIRGWIRPACGVGEFLEAYSRAGGTHHNALVMGNHMETIEAFGRLSGCEVVIISGE